MRFLLYSHDGMGFGHVRRQLAIASAVTDIAPNCQVLLATSVDEVSSLGLPPNVDTLKLPGLRKLANEHYGARRLAMAPEEIHNFRSSLLLAAVKSFRPDLVLVDKHPFGASGEFRPALEAARSFGARAVLGLRDILDDATTVLRQWSDRFQELILKHYDRLFIYGDRSIFDPREQYQFSPALAERTRFCGYVVHPSDAHWNSGYRPWTWVSETARRLVIATTGGGEDGFHVLRTFILSCGGSPWKGIAVAGPLLDNREFLTLQQLANDNDVTLHRFLPGLSDMFWVVDALVCMGGYNTLVEALSTGLPTVCVPRTRPRTEQLIRARSFERLGLLRTIHPDGLAVSRMREEIETALSRSRDEIIDQATEALNFGGRVQAANALLEVANTFRTPGRISFSIHSQTEREELNVGMRKPRPI
jgi:predicted glycosyltransferase